MILWCMVKLSHLLLKLCTSFPEMNILLGFIECSRNAPNILIVHFERLIKSGFGSGEADKKRKLIRAFQPSIVLGAPPNSVQRQKI